MQSARSFSFVVVVFLLTIILPGCGDPYGITPSHPLATFEIMDRILTDDKGLERSERTLTVAECFRSELHEKLGELKVFQYEEYAKSSVVKHVVLIAVDEVHIVRAVAGAFHSGRQSFSDSGGKAESYLCGLWAAVNGGPAEFTKRNEPGVDVNEYLLSTIEKGGVHGLWKKMPGAGVVAHHATIQDKILLWID
jgi:hypothetical protein